MSYLNLTLDDTREIDSRKFLVGKRIKNKDTVFKVHSRWRNRTQLCRPKNLSEIDVKYWPQ